MGQDGKRSQERFTGCLCGLLGGKQRGDVNKGILLLGNEKLTKRSRPTLPLLILGILQNLPPALVSACVGTVYRAF